MFRFLVLVSLLIMSAGCSTLPADQSGWQANTQTSKTLVGDENGLDVIGQTPIGASVMLEKNLYQVVNEYTAASGRNCRGLREQRNITNRVACQGNDAHWYLRPALIPDGSSVSPLAQSSAVAPNVTVVEPELESIATIESSEILAEQVQPSAAELQKLETVAVVTNENLWRFAKRVTGNALNWQAIARINGITDVNSLRVGQNLRIPSQLQVQARAKTRSLATGG